MLSTLDDVWVAAFTPFRSKVCLVGFLMTMVLPNMKHAWGFAGFKDRHDALRREAEATIEDGSRSSDCHRVANAQLEKERQHIHQVRTYSYVYDIVSYIQSLITQSLAISCFSC